MVSVDLSDGEVTINQCCSRRSESPVKPNTVGDFVFGEELFVKLNVIIAVVMVVILCSV